ncbi:MAG TPA: MFS transporter, partial [Anaeromyxobacteraceae bacterium]|nr:MFS transporter [Anaeromyxobacteraceae bacterium]
MAFLRNKRIQILGLLSISSGMPLGFITNTLQIFLRGAGVDLTTIGLLQSVSLPWTVKFLWSPLVDRFALPWPGRRRSWVLLAQLGLALVLGALAAYAARSLGAGPSGRTVLAPGAAGVIAVLALVFVVVAATQDIAIDAYAVEVLHPDEVGPASGLRIAWYRIGMLGSSAAAVFASQWLPWPVVFGALAALFLLFTGLTLAAPEPEQPAAPPRSLASAVWEPFQSYFRRPDAAAIAAFLVFYKFGDNLGLSMVNPFLKDLCFSNAEIGLAAKTIGTFSTVAGAGMGAALMTRMGLGRALWVFGLAQAGSMLLYTLAAATHHGAIDIAACSGAAVPAATRAATYLAIAGEYSTQGMATAAMIALVTRVCEKRYSATQYALLSSLFGLGRVASGPPSGFLAQALGYQAFFAVSALCALPGLLLLQRIAPIGQRGVPSLEAP